MPGVEPLRVALSSIPEQGCRAVADGRVLLARVDGEVVAYVNSCLHRGSAMDTGVVREGTLTCPAHLWRYRLTDGACLNGPGRLQPVPAAVVDGDVEVTPPAGDPDLATTLRERLLAHARAWERDL